MSNPKNPLVDACKSAILHEGLVFVETDDPALMVEIRMDARVSKCIEALLSPTVALVLPTNADAVVEALRKAGQTPKVNA